MIADETAIDYWESMGLTEPGIFLPCGTGLSSLEIGRQGFLSSAEQGPYPRGLQQMNALTDGFFRTRIRYPEAELGSAIYVSSLPDLLFLEERNKGDGAEIRYGDREDEDAAILGQWVSGGMNIAFTDEKRIKTYAAGMTDLLYEETLKRFGWRRKKTEYIPEIKMDSIGAEPSAKRRERESGEFSLPGREEVETFFREQVIDVIDRGQEYKQLGIPFPGPTLLVGPPGCGKTYAVEKLGKYLGWPIFYVNSATIASSYIHETSRKIAELFQKAMDYAPAIVVMDEMEAYLSEREGAGGTGGMAHREEMAEFLRIMPRLAENRVLLFAMTNMPDIIDPAILRKGRFDNRIDMDYPSWQELKEMLEHRLEGLPKEEKLNLNEIASQLAGRPISDMDYVLKEAGRLAVLNRTGRISQRLLKEACKKLGPGNGKKDRRRIGF